MEMIPIMYNSYGFERLGGPNGVASASGIMMLPLSWLITRYWWSCAIPNDHRSNAGCVVQLIIDQRGVGVTRS